jgi:hypothetical protein
MAEDDPSIFLTLGHGDEEIDVKFEDRIKLPEGFVLVTLAQCGAVTTSDTVHPIMDAFCDPSKKELLQDPFKNRNEISRLIGGTNISVYGEGDSVPDLGLYLFTEWIIKPAPAAATGIGGKEPASGAAGGGGGAGSSRAGLPASGGAGLILPGLAASGGAGGGGGGGGAAVHKVEQPSKLRVLRSGVYKFPKHGCFDLRGIENTSMEKGKSLKYKFVSTDWSGDEPTVLHNKNEILEIYKDSLFPTQGEMNTILDNSGMRFRNIREMTYFKLHQVFERLGKGVYYFVVCRSVREKPGIGSLTKKVMNSNINFGIDKNLKTNANKVAFNAMKKTYKEAKDKIQYYPAIFPYVLSSAQKIRADITKPNIAKNWRSPFLNDPRFLKSQYKTVKRARRMSLAQQTKGNNAAADAVGGAGGAENFALPAELSGSLEDILSDMPHPKMAGVTDEIMLEKYDEAIKKHDKYENDIKNDLVRVLINNLPTIYGSDKFADSYAALDSRLADIERVYSPYPDVIAKVKAKIETSKQILVDNLIRSIISKLPKITGLEPDRAMEVLNARLAEIKHEYSAYPKLYDFIESKLNELKSRLTVKKTGGGKRRTRRRRHSRKK